MRPDAPNLAHAAPLGRPAALRDEIVELGEHGRKRPCLVHAEGDVELLASPRFSRDPSTKKSFDCAHDRLFGFVTVIFNWKQAADQVAAAKRGLQELTTAAAFRAACAHYHDLGVK